MNLRARVGGLLPSKFLRGRPVRLGANEGWIPPRLPIMDGVSWIDAETDDQGQTPQCGPYMVSNWCAAVRYMNGGVSDDRGYPPAELYRAAGGDGTSGTTLEGCFEAAKQLGWIHPTATVMDVPDFRTLHTVLGRTRYAWLGIVVDTNWQRIGGDGYLEPGGTPLPDAGHALLVCGIKPGWVLTLTCWGDFGARMNGVSGYIWIAEETFAARMMDCHVIYKDIGEGVIGI